MKIALMILNDWRQSQYEPSHLGLSAVFYKSESWLVHTQLISGVLQEPAQMLVAQTLSFHHRMKRHLCIYLVMYW